jgi:hypothetical protein
MANPKSRATIGMWQGFIVLLGTAVLAVATMAESSLTPHSAEYKVKISVLGGQLVTELKSTQTGYVATHVIRPTGMSRMFARGTISESSAFDTAPDGVRPTEYSSSDTISRDKTKVSIRFDWETGEARGTVNDEDLLSVMDTLAHDRVSIQYELMHDLLNNEPSTEYTMFEIDRLRTVNVRNIGVRKVKVPAGEYEAVGIQHQAEGSKRVTTLWCVEELDYLPVIIEQHRKGKLRVRAVLNKYTPAAGST